MVQQAEGVGAMLQTLVDVASSYACQRQVRGTTMSTVIQFVVAVYAPYPIPPTLLASPRPPSPTFPRTDANTISTTTSPTSVKGSLRANENERPLLCYHNTTRQEQRQQHYSNHACVQEATASTATQNRRHIKERHIACAIPRWNRDQSTRTPTELSLPTNPQAPMPLLLSFSAFLAPPRQQQH